MANPLVEGSPFSTRGSLSKYDSFGSHPDVGDLNYHELWSPKESRPKHDGG